MLYIETKYDLLTDLGLDLNFSSSALDTIVKSDSRYIKDLRINLKNVLSSPNITAKESYLTALAIAVNEKNDVLKSVFTKLAESSGSSIQEIGEVFSCASLLATNNVFYRFKHFINSANDAYQNMPAGIKMNIMVNPIMGKELFELISLAVSAVNGCEQCVNSHEAAVRNAGISEQKIFDIIRLASVIKGLSVVIN